MSLNALPVNHRITALDGLRGISISFVVIGHLINHRYGPPNGDPSSSVTGVLSLWGVALFFVISGFIITRLALSEYKTKGRFHIGAFYIRRFFRIIPPFYTYLAFLVVLSGSGFIQQGWHGIARAAAFSCNVPGQYCGWFPGHSWTLAYEEQFYLTFPILFYAAPFRWTATAESILEKITRLCHRISGTEH
jgi:peptidoglycan/LPS O-acetylase OafA/YrhL